MTAALHGARAHPDRRELALGILRAAWQPEGYCVPNLETYPYQWLWDSCFHAVAWAHLGHPDKALEELRHVFRCQDADGFVPHVDYEREPEILSGFWGRSGASSITQPPMYGHALAAIARSGAEVPGDLLERARRGLRFLTRSRQRDRSSGLVTVVHPWESGGDDSPRWDHWYQGRFDRSRAFELKGSWLATIERLPSGAPVGNPAFSAAPIGFNALVAFNCVELGAIIDDDELAADAAELSDALAQRWDADLSTWVDAGPSAGGSGAALTLDGLLPVLLGDRPHEMAQLLDPAGHGAPYGPTGVSRRDPAFAPRTYWRGPAWPQLTYLMWLAATRVGSADVAASLGSSLVAGALISGWAEYWDADDGTGLGAAPQTWTTLAVVADPDRPCQPA